MPDAAGVAVFCMYCGVRFGSSITTDETNSQATPVSGYVVGPRSSNVDPGLTADIPTHAYHPPIEGPDEESDPANEPVPSSVGGFRLLRLLGSGGQGAVYEAEDAASGTRVAVKLLSARYTSSATSVERFRQEGRLASQISHPRCVFVYGADTDAGRPYIVMELMPGATLKDLVDRRGPLPIAEAIARILDAIDGLAEAHRLGVIHRDVKPSNCFVTADDRVKVGDFGLSKSLGGSNPAKHLTGSGRFVGTVLFAPPEQIRGEEVGYDSDVYAVCATLYYSLTGQAPHQHESVTAALAKAISEPPPAVRTKRPDCPKDLDKIVCRGLDRERDRRWQSLTDLREALSSLLPSKQIPARPRALVVAFLIDAVLVQLAAVSFEFLRGIIDGSGFPISGHVRLVSWVSLAVTLAYFTIGEGYFGMTVGKWLLRLRVVRLGEPGPPGLGRALIRTLTFNFLWYVIFLFPSVVIGAFSGHGPAATFFGIVTGIGLCVSGLITLWNQCRVKWKFRGVQDFASGCRVVTRPTPADRASLVSRFGSPLESFRVAPKPLPEAVGGYTIRGLVCDLPGGGMVWAAEDRGLNRRVILDVRPVAAVGHVIDLSPVIRPTRIRKLSTGTVIWADEVYTWTAFVAPAGAPLPDVVNPAKPFGWRDARPILEQLADELRSAEKDGTLPQRLGVDQVWVEPSGRVQLLEFPLPTGTGIGAVDEFAPLGLLRQAAVLMLEGHTWAGAARVKAPLPPHASRIANRLVSPADPYGAMDDLIHDLGESHAHPTRVTSTQRATHVGVQGMFMAFGLGVSFLLTALFSFILVFAYEANAWEFHREVEWAGEREMKEKVLSQPDFQARLGTIKYDDAVDRLEAVGDTYQAQAFLRRETLTQAERDIMDRYVNPLLSSQSGKDEKKLADLLVHMKAYDTVQDAREQEEQEAGKSPQILEYVTLAVVGFFFISWLFCAVLFRGGFSWFLGGLTLVRADGRPAGRVGVFFRSLLVWLPLFALFAGLAELQVAIPEAVSFRIALSAAIPLLLLAYTVIAIRYPDRPPQDRLMGTYLVPV
jgi:hypothetical protein